VPITEAESELVGLGRRYRLAWQQIATMRGTRLPGMCRRIPLESQVRARELVVGEPGLPPREVVRPVAWVCHWFTVYLPDQGWQETPDWPSSLVRAGGAQRAAIRVARTTRRSLYWPAENSPSTRDQGQRLNRRLGEDLGHLQLLDRVRPARGHGVSKDRAVQETDLDLVTGTRSFKRQKTAGP